jgi:hypothetical protein
MGRRFVRQSRPARWLVSMKIVHVISTIDPVGGGPPQVAMRLAAAQATLGHDILLVTYGRPDKLSEERTRQEIACVPYLQAVAIHILPAPSSIERLTSRNAAKHFRQILKGADWLHLHGVWEPLLHKAAAEARNLKIPYCLIPSGMLNPWSLEHKRWKKKLGLALGIRRFINRASFIHCLSSDEAKLIEPLELRPRLLVFPNGI